MASYCTVQDVERELTPTMRHAMHEQYEVQNQFDSNLADYETQVKHNIRMAQQVIDAKLAIVFITPFTDATVQKCPLITDICARIAAWVSGENIAAKEKTIQSKYDEARVWLQDIVDAKMLPGLTPEENDELKNGSGSVYWKSRKPEYPERKLALWDEDSGDNFLF